MNTTQTAPANTSETCETIVRLIMAGDSQGEELLYSTFVRGLRFLAARYCSEYADDCVHDAILTVCKQIKQGQLKIPAALPGYINIVLKRAAWNKKLESERHGGNSELFETVVQTKPDNRNDPERRLQIQERAQILREGLQSLKPKEQEILTRFYLRGESQDEICGEMNLTDTQFRLHKSRSKQKLEAFTSKRLRKPIRPAEQFAARAAACS